MEITEAIILNVVDYDERDGIVTAFFKDGRIMNIYAQGIQGENSKNRLNLMQFSIVELEYFQKKDRNKAKLMRSTTIVEPTMKNLNDIHLLAGLSSLIDFRLAAGTRIYELFELIIREME
jgi:recombinational DNA repair protein (RecF pathway)